MSSLRLEKGSTILVTGITGYIGAWVANEALALGYKVRGAVRSLEKAQWLQTYFDSKYPGQYTQTELPSVLDKTALAGAVKGVQGIIHVSVNTQLSPEPEPYIPEAVTEALNVLEVAHEDGGIKSIVMTSSSMAAVPWGATGTLQKDSYNEEYIKLAYDASFQHPAKMFMVYAAAKANAEKGSWKWVSDNKPAFALNIILPAANFGPSLVFEKQGYASTGGWPKALFDSDLSLVSNVPAQYFVDVRDIGRLHVAALLDNATSGERLWGFAEPYNWNQILDIFRKEYPDRKFVDNLEGITPDTSVPPTESALKALKNVYGQEGWTALTTSLEESKFAGH